MMLNCDWWSILDRLLRALPLRLFSIQGEDLPVKHGHSVLRTVLTVMRMRSGCALMAKVNHLNLAFTHAAQPLCHQAAVTAMWIFLEAKQANARFLGARENLPKSVFAFVEKGYELPRKGHEVHAVLEGLAVRAGVTQSPHVQILDTRGFQSRGQLGLRKPSLAAQWDVTDINNGFDFVLGKGGHPL